jgi:hypothetical protein
MAQPWSKRLSGFIKLIAAIDVEKWDAATEMKMKQAQ